MKLVTKDLIIKSDDAVVFQRLLTTEQFRKIMKFMSMTVSGAEADIVPAERGIMYCPFARGECRKKDCVMFSVEAEKCCMIYAYLFRSILRRRSGE